MNRDICVLITGSNGFVGKHLTAALADRLGGPIVATGRLEDGPTATGEVEELDVTDPRSVVAAISKARPTHVIHLSAVSAPADARADPTAAWMVNALGTLHVAEAILRHVPDCRLLLASTGLVYGASTGEPFDELSPVAPASDYAVTKTAADLLVGAMANRGLKSIRLRLFNHTGPGQSELFVVPRFAAQIARIEAGLQPPKMRVGNLLAVRDMLDVRDVVEAYTLAIERSENLAPAVVLNIASGVSQSIGEILSSLLRLSSTSVEIELIEQTVTYSADQLVGNANLAERLLGWRPRHDLSDTLRSVLDYWRQRVREEADRPAMRTEI
jgi:GDP-4-dehydro-6-deoxy-D-mannose reductase